MVDVGDDDGKRRSEPFGPIDFLIELRVELETVGEPCEPVGHGKALKFAVERAEFAVPVQSGREDQRDGREDFHDERGVRPAF